VAFPPGQGIVSAQPRRRSLAGARGAPPRRTLKAAL